MDYIELEKLYRFATDNNLSISKHNIKMPSRETVEKLVEEYHIAKDISKRIQVLEDKKNVSFVMGVGGVTLFETLCGPLDEFTVSAYYCDDEE